MKSRDKDFPMAIFFPSLIEFCFYFSKNLFLFFFTSDLHMKSWLKTKTNDQKKKTNNKTTENDLFLQVRKN